MAKPILTLTTDFGLSDHYVGTMKGVMLGICPQAKIVDISHDVKPFDIAEGAYLIAQAYRYFPKKTVHVVVVDPGVGSSRRPILMEAAGQYFVAPDNGVLSMVFEQEKHRIRVISAERYFRKPVSRTFHGRDIFAPMAAHIAMGLAPARAGKRIEDYVRPAWSKPRPNGKKVWNGQILKVDRFGNLVTNFRAADFSELGVREFTLSAGSGRTSRLLRNYAEGSPGMLFVIEGSSGYLEVSLNLGDAARQIGCGQGSPVELTIR